MNLLNQGPKQIKVSFTRNQVGDRTKPPGHVPPGHLPPDIYPLDTYPQDIYPLDRYPLGLIPRTHTPLDIYPPPQCLICVDYNLYCTL